MSIGLIVIATGKVYRDYAKDMIASAYAFWSDASPVIFTDDVADMRDSHPDETIFEIEPRGFPDETLWRYHTILSQQEALSTFDHLYYADADMLFVDYVGDEVYHPDGIVATLHPGYVGQRGTPETRPSSTAYCSDNFAYYAGGFQGGKSVWYLSACATLNDRIREDFQNNITAVWHDESHWNKYIADADHLMESHVKQLTPSYCYPEDYAGQYGWKPGDFPPILVALDKRKRGNHPRFQ